MSIGSQCPSRKGPKIRAKTGQASAQKTIAHKPAIKTIAPPHRASAERRSNEIAGAVAIPTRCSRATLMPVPYAIPSAIDT
jgi:hypothetical protein